MTFVTWKELHDDVQAWERRLPEFDAIAGVPRSGLFPAAYLALRRNLPLVSLADLLVCPSQALLKASNSSNNLRQPSGNRLLLVDDSSSDNSVTFSRLREQLQSQNVLQITYGAVYRASATSKVDVYFREIPQPRMFEWNWLRHNRLKHAMLDMDGVLCEDWSGSPEKDDDPQVAQRFLSVKPLYVPTVPVLKIVTSRLEKYREQTEVWLRKHRIEYGELIMHPATSAAARREAKDHARRKADVYGADPAAWLFVESNEKQAAEIFRLTGKSVLCADTFRVLAGSDVAVKER